jgi:prepilin-type N-terminal cleavage/methylation domain-containing protein
LDGEELTGADRARGVTLVELLVVMAILAFLAGVVALNGPPLQSAAKREAEIFAARARAAFEQSAIDGAVYAIAVTPAGYRVEKLVNGAWTPAESGRYLSARKIARGVALAVSLADPAARNRDAREKERGDDEPARIVLDPIGTTTPFAAEFSDRAGVWIVRNRTDEAIVLEKRGG